MTKNTSNKEEDVRLHSNCLTRRKFFSLSTAALAGLILHRQLPEQEKLAAAEESPLLDRDFWGFDQKTIAVSARYEPAKARFVVIAFYQQLSGLEEKVKTVFSEYLLDVASEDGMIKGKNAAGRFFVFRHKGDRAFLVLGEPDWERALQLLGEAAGKN